MCSSDLIDSSTTQSMTGMCAGNYIVTVADANGCYTTDSGNLSQPTALSSAVIGNDASCSASCDGDATVIGSGGTSPYTYLWSDGQSSATATGLCAGDYTVTVSDFNGCSSIGSVTINEPAFLTISISGNDVSCNGASTGSATVVAGGGTSPYSYIWSEGSVLAINDSLIAGNYSVTVTDANGCTINSSVMVSEPTSIVISTTVVNPACGASDGKITASVTGGTSPYSYLWNDSSTTSIITGLPAGSYSLTVTDFNGCEQSSVVGLSNAGAASLSSVITNVLCNGSTNGAID